MTILFIANCSKQEHNFTYALPENMRPFYQSIRAGGQIKIEGSLQDVNSIIDQHKVYGLQNAKEIGRNFGGICYQIDQVIDVESIHHGFSQTEKEQIDRALEAQKITAVASDQILANKAQEFGVQQKAPLEIEVTEQKLNAADTAPKMSQVIEVVRDGMQPRSRNRKQQS
jgi:hypothetical protein